MTSTAFATMKDQQVKTFRFEFSKYFIEELSRFSKVHQYDERHTYKKEWNTWKSNPEIAEIMEMEKRRLEENGYMGDIEDKMYKSGRYYFRKKNIAAATTPAPVPTPAPATPTPATEYRKQTEDDNLSATPATPATPAKQRKPYITMSKSSIQMMDAHIKQCSTTANFKPSSCYDNFYSEKMPSAEMAAEIGKIIEKYEHVRQTRKHNSHEDDDSRSAQTIEDITNEIMDKIKKTYKNRYYRFINGNNNGSNKNNTIDHDHDHDHDHDDNDA